MLRDRFPIFERLVYVNSCSQGALSDAVQGAYDEYLNSWRSEGSPWGDWVARVEAARGTFAALIGADADEIAVTTSLSQGVNALLSGLRFPAGRDTIVVSDFEFPTVGQIAHAQELRGLRVVHVPEAGDGTIPVERFADAIDERTALVAFPSICYRNGGRLDPAPIARIAHERGALVLLDAYQALGALPVDVRALEIDFLAAGAVKYLLGSAGIGFLYCRRSLISEITPTQTGWFADEDVFAMDIHDYSPAASARRFESGTPPIPAAYAAHAGIELVRGLGVEKTAAHVSELADRLLDGLDELGATAATPQDAALRGPLVAVRASDEHALVAALRADGIVTSSRDGNVRVSFHAYNTAEDVDAVLASLSRMRTLLR